MESEEKAGWQNCVLCVCVRAWVCVTERERKIVGKKNEYLYIAQNVSEKIRRKFVNSGSLEGKKTGDSG